MPSPHPAVGGIPYSKAVQKSSSISCASSSPCFFAYSRNPEAQSTVIRYLAIRHLRLLLKSLPLNQRIIEISVGIHELRLRAEQLETLSQTGEVAMHFSQRTYDFRIIAQKGRVHEINFDQISNQL